MNLTGFTKSSGGVNDKSTWLRGYMIPYRLEHANATYKAINTDETHDVDMSDDFAPLSVILYVRS
jgi:hypothetical protein